MRFLKILALALVAGLVLARSAFAAGTVVVTSAEVGTASTKYMRYTVAWTSTAGGVVSGNAFAVAAGRLISIRFDPGPTTPTDLYDLTLSDGDVTDLLTGLGANLSNSVPSLLQWDPPLVEDGSRTYDVVIANAGASKTGTIVLLIETFNRN